MDASVSRRRFLAQGAGGLSSVWVSAHWPALLAAATHARHAAQSAVAAKFEFFGAEEAKEVDAVTSRIIPSDETPGAHEAGVVYFIDRALTAGRSAAFFRRAKSTRAAAQVPHESGRAKLF